ncbi:MAG: hypothetical protein KF770_11860 [Anaerolineae bacterium]|nr:hypothetical protein [Anaerolineae bacterium]
MLQTTLDDVLARVRAQLEHDDLTGAVALIESLRSPDQAELFAEPGETDEPPCCHNVSCWCATTTSE